ncbi:hypothetical protein FCV25MIE_16498 [Fagus crenata]
MDHKGPVVKNHLVGPTARPTFEIGRPAGSPDIGLTNGPVLISHQAKIHMPTLVEPQNEMVNPGQLEIALTHVFVDAQAAIQRKDTHQDEIAHHMGWYFQMADGCRLVLPKFIPPPWSQVGVFPPPVIPNSDEPTPNLVTGLSDDGVAGRKTEPTGSQLVSTALELVGGSYEGYEEEVITLLQKIELQRPQPRASPKPSPRKSIS